MTYQCVGLILELEPEAHLSEMEGVVLDLLRKVLEKTSCDGHLRADVLLNVTILALVAFVAVTIPIPIIISQYLWVFPSAFLSIFKLKTG